MAPASFHELAREWAHLLAGTDSPTVFQLPQWLGTWWEHFHADRDLCLLAVRDQGELVGVAPLMVHEGTASFIAETDVCDYHDFVVKPGRHAGFFASVLAYLRSQGIERVHLSGLPATSPTLVELPGPAAEAGFTARKELEEVSPFVELPGNWEEFLQRLDKKDRHELRRKLRRLEEADPQYRFESVSDGPTTAERVGLFCDLMRSSREDKRMFLSPARERFFRDLTSHLAQERLARLSFLEVTGRTVASSLCFSFGGTYSLYNSGFDPEYARLSVGLLLKALCIKDAIAHGARRFDFLRGAESYKYDLGAQDAPVYRITLTR